MSFTYIGDLSTDLDKVRFYINDKSADKGPKPEAENYTDEEINGVLALADSWEDAVANYLDALAMAWVIFPSFTADNFAISRSHITKNYQAQAQWWRDNHGLASLENKYGSPGSEPITRVDAYSDDKDSATE